MTANDVKIRCEIEELRRHLDALERLLDQKAGAARAVKKAPKKTAKKAANEVARKVVRKAAKKIVRTKAKPTTRSPARR